MDKSINILLIAFYHKGKIWFGTSPKDKRHRFALPFIAFTSLVKYRFG